MCVRGSVEATKYAQSLIEALINDTDKKFEQQLPKMKPLQTTTVSHAGVKQKSASNVKSSGANGVTNILAKDDQLLRLSATKSTGAAAISNFTIGAWQPQQQQSASSVKSSSVVNAAVTVASAWCGDSAAVRASPEMNKMSYSDRAKAIIVSSSNESASVSRSPPVDKMTASSAAPCAGSGSVGSGVQFTASVPTRCEPQPLPIVAATGFPGSAAVSRLSGAAAASSVMRDYSPFDNALSQIIAESVLAKRTDDFASVAAAGVITSSSPLSVSYSEDATAVPLPASASDPHKAPGYKISACSDPAKAPGHRASKDPSTASRATTTTSTNTESGSKPSEYGQPSSTSNVAVGSSLGADSGGPVSESSLDRPASYYITSSYRPNLAYPVPPPPPGLMQLGPMQTGDVYMPAVSQFGAGRAGAVTETTVLAAPLMATSLASVSHADNTVHHFNLPPSVSTSAATTAPGNCSTLAGLLLYASHGGHPTGIPGNVTGI